jgi:hypothetical protein
MAADVPPGQIVAQVGETTYVELHAIVAVKPGYLTYYCSLEDWPASPAAAGREEKLRIPCPHCQRMFLDKRGYSNHVKRCVAQPAPTEAVSAGAQHWQCAECRTDVFAADLRMPHLCLRCSARMRKSLSVRGAPKIHQPS